MPNERGFHKGRVWGDFAACVAALRSAMPVWRPAVPTGRHHERSSVPRHRTARPYCGSPRFTGSGSTSFTAQSPEWWSATKMWPL